jgi:hypothetical protein
MAELVEVQIDGKPIVFATAGSREGGPAAYTGAGAVVSKAQETFDQALDTVRVLGGAVSRKLEGLAFANAEVEFGITITGSGKFIVAEASAEASVKVTLTFDGARQT